MPTGIPEIDSLAGGLPRGAITEVFGPASSGRTTLLVSALAEGTARQEVCALVDSTDAFDPAPAAAAGVDLSRLLWVRCGKTPAQAEGRAPRPAQSAGRQPTSALRWSDGPAPTRLDRALRVAALLVEGGGFGLVVLDLGDVAPRNGRRIPLSCWFRLRRAVENTPTILLLIGQEPYTKSCASLVLEMSLGAPVPPCGTGAPRNTLLRGAHFQAIPRKPARSATASFVASYPSLV